VSEAILCLNAGSSSLKFALFQAADEPALIARGQIEGIGTAPRLIVRDAGGAILAEERWPGGAGHSHDAFLAELLGWVDDHLGTDRLAAVGHRIVHGGADFAAPVRLDEAILTRLDALSPLAPLHQPANIAAVRAVWTERPGLAQVGCFDTGFHRTMPRVATRFALTAELDALGVRRYGFHGLSYEYIARCLAALDPRLASGRVIAGHLGAGASLCALNAGVSLDTTMGFTAVDGLMMATRCGALDPGVLLYLMQSLGYDAAGIEDLIYRRSGLLGVSGVSSDMRAVQASATPNAKVAIELFIFRIAREAGALVSTLGGLDGLVFTAGIGENDSEVRARVCDSLAWLGVDLDAAANAADAPVISTPKSVVTVRVIPTDEERMIALHTSATLGMGAAAAA
jgi:acetate kinase